MNFIKSIIIVLCIIANLSFSVSSSESNLPESITLGQDHLLLNGMGVRKRLFVVKIYYIGLYLPWQCKEVSDITQHMPHAFIVNIQYSSNKGVGIPQVWKEELLPILSRHQEEKLKSSLSEASLGEFFRVEYRPEKGTQVLLEDNIILSEDGYELMSAFINVWLGPKPISHKLSKKLLSN